MGRIGRELELKKTNSGVSVVSFPLAVDRNGKDAGTDWIDVVVWRGTAEVLCNYADKGRMIVVEGRLQMRDWTDKNGNKRRSVEVQADSIYFADSRAGNSTRVQNAAEGATDGFAEVSEDDGELPF
nr:MAG TPA: Single strand binding protein [Caudoviricetes sp.]